MAVVAGTVLGGTYRLVRQIGVGGMGEVWEAQHARLAGRYAVKFFLADVASDRRKEIAARFQREAEITSRLQHPHIVQVIDFNHMPDGAPYMVMEYLRGENIAQLIARVGRLSPAQAARIVGQAALGLAAAHDAGVVHRDLTPSNLFLVEVDGSEGAFVKILDFGISKVRAASRGLTAANAVMGTANYMSPEQARRTAEVDERTDQYALAAILYEMLAGRPAFDSDDPMAVYYQILHEPPPPLPPDIPPEVAAIVMRGLEKDRLKRFASIGEFSRAVQTVSGSGASGTPIPLEASDFATTRPGRAASPPRRAAEKRGGAAARPSIVLPARGEDPTVVARPGVALAPTVPGHRDRRDRPSLAAADLPRRVTTFRSTVGELGGRALRAAAARPGIWIGMAVVTLGSIAVALVIRAQPAEVNLPIPTGPAPPAPSPPVEPLAPTPLPRSALGLRPDAAPPEDPPRATAAAPSLPPSPKTGNTPPSAVADLPTPPEATHREAPSRKSKPASKPSAFASSKSTQQRGPEPDEDAGTRPKSDTSPPLIEDCTQWRESWATSLQASRGPNWRRQARGIAVRYASCLVRKGDKEKARRFCDGTRDEDAWIASECLHGSGLATK